MLQWLMLIIKNAICLRPAMGLGAFDPIDGTYDEQTSFDFDPMLITEARTRSIVGAFSRGSKAPEDMMLAGGSGKSLDNTAIIVRKKIDSGDMVRFSMQEHMKGNPTHGDEAVVRGDFLGYKNLEARVNMIKTPAIPLQGEMSLQRVKKSLGDVKSALRREVIDYLAEEMEFEFLIACAWGASKSILKSEANGGLGISLGVGSGGGAGIPLMAKNFYSIDAGFPAYNDTPATWNSTINGHVNTTTVGADGLTALKMKVLRRQLDKINFAPVIMDGVKYKSVNICDPDTWYRLDHLLKTDKSAVHPRSIDHQIFGVDHMLQYHGMLFLNVPNLEKFRPAYDAAQGYPDIGPNLTDDPRSYTTSSSVAWLFCLGSGAVFEGYTGTGRITTETGYHTDGFEVGARTKLGYVRGEWYAKDGRASSADNCYCNSFLNAIFFEEGVNTLT